MPSPVNGSTYPAASPTANSRSAGDRAGPARQRGCPLPRQVREAAGPGQPASSQHRFRRRAGPARRPHEGGVERRGHVEPAVLHAHQADVPAAAGRHVDRTRREERRGTSAASTTTPAPIREPGSGRSRAGQARGASTTIRATAPPASVAARLSTVIRRRASPIVSGRKLDPPPLHGLLTSAASNASRDSATPRGQLHLRRPPPGRDPHVQRHRAHAVGTCPRPTACERATAAGSGSTRTPSAAGNAALSTSSTGSPRRASSRAVTEPAGPAPITTASQRSFPAPTRAGSGTGKRVRTVAPSSPARSASAERFLRA